MELSITPVTSKNRAAAENLRVAPNQTTFIETVAECMQEADQLSGWHPMCILADGQIVGFTMYGYFVENGRGRLWFDRLLIDQKYQGRGYGKHAIRVILGQMRQEFPGMDIFLSVYDDNPHAIALYEYFGFAFNGELDTKGEKIMILHPEQPFHF